MADVHELADLKSASAVQSAAYVDIETTSARDKDREALARLGKEQILKRRFGFLSMFGFSCTILTTWEATLPLFTEGFENGGPAGLVYGFLIAWAGSLSVFSVIGELASMAPTAGGQYYWVNMLAPDSSRKFLSYITGWITTIAWIATLATGGFITGTTIQGLIVLNYPNYNFLPVHGTLLTWAVLLVAVFVNTVVGSLLPKIEGVILVLHVLGFFAIMIPLVYSSPHSSASTVFTTFLNEGGWPTQGVSFCVGIIGAVASFVGADAAVHMSEEMTNAALNVPRAIFTSVFLNGVLGFSMLMALLFCLGNIQNALETPTGYPYIEIFAQGTGSLGGTTAMVSIVTVLSTCATIGFLASTSRMAWSFAYDKGLPFSKILTKVERRTSIPMYAILLVTIIPALLALINIGSTSVFYDVISLSTSGFYASYFVPCTLLLWRRLSASGIAPHSTHAPQPAFVPGGVATPPLVWGPWRVPGMWGTINNAVACAWMVFVVFWSFWPPATPATPQSMNYSVLVTGAAILFSIVYYYVWGRKRFRGPLVGGVGSVGKEGE